MSFGTGKFITFFSLAIVSAAVFFAPNDAVAFSLFSSKNPGNNCAVLRGAVNNTYNGNTSVWFEYGQRSSNKISSTSEKKVSSLSGNFSEMVVNIKPGTIYYYRMVVETDSGRSYGNDVSFTIGNGPVSYYYGKYSCENTAGVSIVSVGNISSFNTNTTGYGGVVQGVPPVNTPTIGDTGAVLNALFYPLQGTQTFGWFEWGRTPDLGNRTPQRFLGSATSVTVSEILSNLQPGTTYFYKTVTQSGYGTQSGVLYSFRTTGAAPFLTTVSEGNENYAPLIPENKDTNKKTIADSEKETKETGSSEKNNSGTSTFGSIAAAGAADGNPFFSPGTWVIFIGNILFLLAIYFLYVFFSDKKDDIGYVGNGEEVKNAELIAELTKRPDEKKETAVRGAPPANLPV